MEKLKSLLKIEGIAWITASIMTVYSASIILCALVMFLTNNFLTNWLIVVLNVISFILAYFFFTIGFSSLVGSKDNLFKNITNYLPVAIGYLFVLIINVLLSSTGIGNYLIVGIIFNILDGFIIVASLCLANALSTKKMMVLNVSNIIRLGGLSLLIYALPTIIGVLLSLVIGGSLFVGTLLINLICSLVEAIFIVVVSKYVNAKGDTDFKKDIKDIILIGITVLLLVVYILLSTLLFNTNKVKSIDNYMSYSLASGDYAFDNQNVLAAKELYESARDYKCAWDYVLNEDNDGRSCNGEYITLFKTLNKEDAIKILKKKVNNKEATTYDLEALMYLMDQSKDKDKGKIVKFLISDMKFTRSTVLPFDLNDNEKKEAKEKLAAYENRLIARKYIDVYAEWLKEGSINSMVVSKASGLADEYPEILGLQKAAINFYINATDNVKGSTGVVNRFVELTKDKIKDLSDDKIINYKTYVTLAYHKTNGNDKLVEFLENTYPDKINDYMGEELIVAYKKKGDHEKATEVALKLLKTSPENVTALSYLAVHVLQSNLDASIEYALKLANIMANNKDNAREADIALGMYMVYLFGYYEVPDSSFCPYHNFYSDMTDDTKSLLKNNEIINAYIAGYRRTDGAKEILNKVLDKYDITYLLYYRGSMEVDAKEYEAAVKDLEKAITLGNNHPFIYSELGFAYEGIGDLKKSITVFEKADQIIDELGLGSTTYNYNNIHNYFSVYINNAKHAMYESEGDHNE